MTDQTEKSVEKPVIGMPVSDKRRSAAGRLDPTHRSHAQHWPDTLTHMSRSRKKLPLIALCAVAAVGLTACVSAPALIERPTKDENFQKPEAPPEFFPEGTADENLPYFHETLRQFAVGTAPVQGAPVVDALAAAGFDKTKMQVSFDESKTDLVADNIFVSVLIGQDCLIGQVVVADRSFVTEAAPAVGPDKSLCLIGTTRPIDW